MKYRDSGMPAEDFWESLLNVPLILDRLGLDETTGDVVELGCGYGTFTVPIAKRIWGVVFAFDIEAELVGGTSRRAALAGLSNVQAFKRDVQAEGFGLPDGICDACLLFNILHGEEPAELLGEAARVVRPGGSVDVIHWRHDPRTPRGPPLEIRPRPEQVLKWAESTGRLETGSRVIDLPPWHYGVRLARLKTQA